MRALRTQLLCAMLAAAAGLAGCATLPEGRAAIDTVDVVGARAVDPHDITDKIATAASPKFLGLMQGIANDYAIYDPSVLQRDLARVERFYRGKGFFEAHVRVGRVVRVGKDHVRVEIVVDEGPPMTNGEVKLGGLDGLPPPVAASVTAATRRRLRHGARFDEDGYSRLREFVVRELTDRGYAYAAVTADAQADMSRHTIDYSLVVEPGIPAVFGPITFAGLDPDGAGPAPQEIEEPILRRVLEIKEGDAYSTARIASATQALLDLEVFSGVTVVPGLSTPPTRVVPLVVQVQPTKLRALKLGGGFEFDAIKTDVHVLTGWEDHNLLGGLRDLSIDLKPGVALYPTNIYDLNLPSHLFAEERLRVQFRQPAFLEARTTAFAQPELNVYPLLVETKPTVQNAVPGYVEPKMSFGLERRFGTLLFTKLAYNVQGEVPFDYYVPPGSVSPASTLPGVLLLFPQLLTQFQVLDDAKRPHAGFSANLDLQAAGIPFASSSTIANDLRIQPDVEGYIPLGRRVTLALTTSLGFLFPYNYGEIIQDHLPAVICTPGSFGAPFCVDKQKLSRDIQTVYFRGFFSGGPSSNRGYPLRGVAPHGFVPFLNPATARATVAAGCDPNAPQGKDPSTEAACSSPMGGFTMWEASIEARIAISGPLGAAVFCDAGDVSQHVGINHLRLSYPHVSCGVGGRYDTPVGPIRLDLGLRVPWLQILGQPNEAKAEQFDPTFGYPPTPLGLPLAFAFGLGEAF